MSTNDTNVINLNLEIIWRAVFEDWDLDPLVQAKISYGLLSEHAVSG